MPEIINLGDPAPDFMLPDHEGNEVKLSSFRGRQPVLLVFYPGDETYGCTKQLCAIRDDWAEFQRYQVAAFGINHADAESHTKFWRHHGLKTPLLVDYGMKVSEHYGATRRILGKEIINRSVILIDKQGIIRYLKRGLPPDSEILEAVKKLS